MEVYSIGGDELDWPEREYAHRFAWIVYDYEDHSDDYYGCGEAVALGHDGLLYAKSLSHCSCFGPQQEGSGDYDGEPWLVVDRAEYLPGVEHVLTPEHSDPLTRKVRELLGVMEDVA